MLHSQLFTTSRVVRWHEMDTKQWMKSFLAYHQETCVKVVPKQDIFTSTEQLAYGRRAAMRSELRRSFPLVLGIGPKQRIRRNFMAFHSLCWFDASFQTPTTWFESHLHILFVQCVANDTYKKHLKIYLKIPSKNHLEMILNGQPCVSQSFKAILGIHRVN